MDKKCGIYKKNKTIIRHKIFYCDAVTEKVGEQKQSKSQNKNK